LVTKNTRDEAYRWTAHHKEKRMHQILHKLKDNIQKELEVKKQPTLKQFVEENKVKIFADFREKGSGIVMCCTFGDTTDVEWYLSHSLPLKVSIDKKGRMNEKAGKYKGMKIKEARKIIIEDLKKEGVLKNQKKITHTVNVHER
jgi:valyl-tRNA synthetase